MPSRHLILCHPLLLLHSIFPSIRVFSNESVLHIRWPKYRSFSFSIIQWCRPAINIYFASVFSLPPPFPSHPSRSSQSTKLSFPPATSFTHDSDLCQRYFLNSSYPLLSLLCPQVHSLSLHLPSLQIGSSVEVNIFKIFLPFFSPSLPFPSIQ